jgi:hypothetical protein
MFVYDAGARTSCPPDPEAFEIGVRQELMNEALVQRVAVDEVILRAVCFAGND